MSADNHPALWFWKAPEGEAVHASALGHGALYAWAGPSIRAVKNPLTPEGGSEETWTLRAGVGGQPAPEVAFTDRIAVVGEGLMLARQSGFGWLRTRSGAGVEPFTPNAVPLAQASWPLGWAGWVRRAGEAPSFPAELWLASLDPGSNSLMPFGAYLPDPGAALAPRAAIAVRGRRACWLGVDGGLWQADIESGDVTRVSRAGLLSPESGIGASQVWMDASGRPGVVAEVGAGASLVAWVAPASGQEQPRAPAPAGAGPLRSVHVLRQWLVVVGEQILVLHSGDATAAHDGNTTPIRCPRGRWVAGCLTVEERRESSTRLRQFPQLIALTDDANLTGGGQGTATLAAVDLHSSSMESIATKALSTLASSPTGLIAAEDSLFVVYSGGIAGLNWKET